MAHVYVGIGQHEIGGQQFYGILSEHFVADHIRHLIVDKAVSFFVAGLNDETLGCFNGFVYVDFLKRGREVREKCIYYRIWHDASDIETYAVFFSQSLS